MTSLLYDCCLPDCIFFIHNKTYVSLYDLKYKSSMLALGFFSRILKMSFYITRSTGCRSELAGCVHHRCTMWPSDLWSHVGNVVSTRGRLHIRHYTHCRDIEQDYCNKNSVYIIHSKGKCNVFCFCSKQSWLYLFCFPSDGDLYRPPQRNTFRWWLSGGGCIECTGLFATLWISRINVCWKFI